ncbi:MAG: galactose-1-phosphate uridylyltransferase [Candidatus Syntrophonatronum acetioxidans]|uniref:Galactose-1-phosphate uridylyltransferase n=1 Tax=Candidatus Syntrophonatronum acetioxidans TaxID=1795816 RepID=A0A424Y8Z2_9FIRM|nr:MAG: galactose-1-phosphate uridylyltransferase [Candidatus Syntrophonatronum acetioxidans]
MSEIRRDIVSDNWVIIATERAQRPESFTLERPVKKIAAREHSCPFCYGNENKTPPEVFAIRSTPSGSNEPGWEVRVIPNKFPALENKQKLDLEKSGIYEFMSGEGVHEVIIETPEHHLSPGSLSLEQVKKIIDSYYIRYTELEEDTFLQYIQIFRNHGKEAGASLEHPHSQLLALPLLPPSVKKEMAEAREFYFQEKECVYCRMLEEEGVRGERILVHNNDYLAFIPYAARLPFEVWILPRRHQSSFSEMREEERYGLAEVLQKVLSMFINTLGDPPYNFYLHSSPTGLKYLPDYHWHFEIIPKLTTVAGFEMGAGMFINISNPEASAEFLRRGH